MSGTQQPDSLQRRRPGYHPRLASRPALILALLTALVVGVLAAPSVTHMLPNTESLHIEDYQPLKALKFFKNKGQEYHKYGPMTNFVLAPVYGVALGWWYYTGQFENPSSDFPYGLKKPESQMTALILGGRITVLLLALTSIVWLMMQLRLLTDSVGVLIASGGLLVATAPFMAQWLVITRPDTVMFTFLAVTLGLYVRIAAIGFRRRTLIALAVFLMMAVSSKEIAGAIWLLPALGVLCIGIARVRDGSIRVGEFLGTILLAAIAGVVTYALINVVYAPEVWLDRMRFWIFGWNPTQIWDSGFSTGEQSGAKLALEFATEFVSQIGVGGILISLIALTAALVFRAPHAIVLSLPLLSYLLFGLGRVGYVPQPQYFVVLPLLLLLPVTVGLSAISQRLVFSGARVAGMIFVLALLVYDGVHATFAWHGLELRSASLIDDYVRKNLDKRTSFGFLSRHAIEPDRNRYDYEGYLFDTRSIAELVHARDSGNLPEVLIVERGTQNWILDAKRRPARARLILEEDGLNVTEFDGVEGLGYTLEQTIEGETPSWYLFDWMRRVRWMKQMFAVQIYRRS